MTLTEMRAQLGALVSRAKAEARSLTAAESLRFEELEALIRVHQARAEQEARQAQAATARTGLGLGGEQRSATGPTVRVKAEERTYRKGGEHRYFQDLAASALPGANATSYSAIERLKRHGQEMEVEARSAKPDSILRRSWEAAQRSAGGSREERALSTSVGAGGTFLPPEYLLDEYVKFPRQSRVLADLVRKQDLPRGPMTIDIPKITASTVVAPQNGQNTAANETDLTDAYVSANVVTWAGQQTVSLQAIEQSAIPFDEIVFQDLNMDLDRLVESEVVAGSGAAGHATGVVNTSGITSVTYTSASPTAIGAWPYFGQAKAKVFDSIYRPADMILMTPDRWAWFEIARDANNRPLVLPTEAGPWNAAGIVTGQLANGATPVGRMLGLPVFVSTALPTNLGASTNQDEVVICSASDLLLWESAPVARALPQTLGNQLSVLLQVYEYGAFMPNRLPGAIATVGGTGFTTPVYS